MRGATKLVFNTLVLMGKTLFGIVSGLVVTRSVLAAMGADDYGLFVTIGASSGLLMVLTNALTDASSRHMSHALGSGDAEAAGRIFNTALRVYLGVASVVALGAVVLAVPIGLFLEMPEERRLDAMIVFALTGFTLSIMTVGSPFTSAATSSQTLGVVAAADMVIAVVRLIGALLLFVLPTDPLMTWAVITIGSQLAGGLLTAVMVSRRVKFARPRRGVFDRSAVKALVGFGGWQVLGSVSWRLRMQGTQVLLNKLFGTEGPKINASYGVGAQLAGFQSALAVPVQQAVYPATIASHGAGRSAQTHDLLLATGKFTFLLTAVFSVPLLIECRSLLDLWLGAERLANLPYVVLLTQLTAGWLLLDTMTRGYIHAVNATGRLGTFTLVNLGLDAGALVLGGLLVVFGDAPPPAVPIATLLMMALQGGFRVVYGGGRIGLPMSRFVREVLLPGLVVTGAAGAVGLATSAGMEAEAVGSALRGFAQALGLASHATTVTDVVRMAAVGAASAAVMGPLAWTLALTADERRRLRGVASGALGRVRRSKGSGAVAAGKSVAPERAAGAASEVV